MTDTTIAWEPDIALEGFEAATLTFPPDADGEVVATLVRRRASQPTGRAVLYVHGFIDYFFQTHLAEAYLDHGYDFYAVDLRKYGRSIRPGQHPNFCRSVDEYFADLTAAIGVIVDVDGHDTLVVNGHSTGGLTTALYAHRGARRSDISALFLNSPFLAQNLPKAVELAVPLVAAVGRFAPYMPVGQLSPFYAQSVHRAHRGEWDFDTRWKPIEGFVARAGWLRAIHVAQKEARKGLHLSCPALVMHSDRSLRAKSWDDLLLRTDSVLDVDDIRRLAARIRPDVTIVEIENGLHDLVLSAPDVRAHVFAELFAWLDDKLPAS